MATKRPVLKVYCLSHPQLATEWGSILGDKYRYALPFDVDVVSTPAEAQVIAWDGVVAKKFEMILPEIRALLQDRILLLTGESTSHLNELKLIQTPKLAAKAIFELPGWNFLPEELLACLEACYAKVSHV
jgi:Ni,Fe-hydrogenase III small subunit